MEFFEIASGCPWRDEIGLCHAVYLMVIGSYGRCDKNECAFWHWFYHLSVLGQPSMETMKKAFDQVKEDEDV